MRAADTHEGRAILGEQAYLDSPEGAVDEERRSVRAPFRYRMTVEPTPVHQQPTEDMRSALIGIDDELRRLHGAPHNVEDHGLAHAWVVLRAALYPAGSKVAR